VAPKFFKSGAEFRRWLDKHHAKTGELLLGFHKTSSGKAGLTYQQALDEALCHGWIDGVRTNIDANRYSIRFTPRKPRSHWSRVNIERAAALKAAGLMHPAGIDAYERRDESRTINYSYEFREAKLGPEYEKRFKANASAWIFFTSQAPSYQRQAKFWVTSAKQEATRDRRLEILIADSAAARRLARATAGKNKKQ
jgi:uncharacterized protein YdeI (YjbR/CyaY-like superfamily)